MGLGERGLGQVAGFENLDFLGEASAILVNLRPNEQGVILIPADALGSHQHLHVVAIDPTQTAFRSLSLPEKPMELVDLRLAAGLREVPRARERASGVPLDTRGEIAVACGPAQRGDAADSVTISAPSERT